LARRVARNGIQHRTIAQVKMPVIGTNDR